MNVDLSSTALVRKDKPLTQFDFGLLKQCSVALALMSFALAPVTVVQAQTSNRDKAQRSKTSPAVSPLLGGGESEAPAKIRKTEQEWRRQLTAEEFYVTRQKGTERAYSGKFWDNKVDGIYSCKCCGQKLFDAKAKFESGTGWPSYFQPINRTAVSNVQDLSAGMVRTETVCSRCNAHLGHVFSDGPRPTGLRYCMNSVSLRFSPRVKRTPQSSVDPTSGNPAGAPGHETPQKLVAALQTAMRENSLDKFIQCNCWERLSQEKRETLMNSKVNLPADVVSTALESRVPTLPAELEFNIKAEGVIEIGFADPSRNFSLPYGRYKGKFYLATPIKQGVQDSVIRN
ncbi:MAG: peptide-methionine (R)-S-oxide reductase MsrB [Mariniblastus sp.]|nr:peptide-methionine (R)-S-oxide reductase MsrB [Mariniblastus sp.]